MKYTFLISLLFITLIFPSCESEVSKIDKETTIENEKLVPVIDSLGENIEMKIIDSSTNRAVEKVDSIKSKESQRISLLRKEKKKEEIKIVTTDKRSKMSKEELAYSPARPDAYVNPPIPDETIRKITEKKETPKVKAEIHKTWDDLLRKHVSSSGKVNYSGFVKDKAELTKYIKELQSFHKDIDSWKKNKRLAYWINTYNAVTVHLITDNHPVKTIKELKGGKPWNTKLIDLGGVSYTLNVIENKIIRPKYNEPRIHFAVNCAAKSCPKIMNKAWTEDNISRYLTKQTKAFVANTNENTISADKVELSKIFDWYKSDFGGDNAKLIQFLNKYSDTKINPDAKVSFKDYNWDLND